MATTPVNAALPSPPKVVASIKPIQLIAAAITDGISSPEVLLPPGSSPHHFALKPSHIRQVTNADLLIWVSPSLESFLPKLLEQKSPHSTLKLISLPDITLLHDIHDHGDKEDHANGHDKHLLDIDPHIWLGPDNVLVIAQHIMLKLSDMDKERATLYQNNYLSFKHKLNDLNKTFKPQLQPDSLLPLVVFHNAYGYLEHYYQLPVVDYVSASPERMLGVKQVVSLREHLKSLGKSCLFVEPQFNSAIVDNLVDELPVTIASLDPLASNITVKGDSYIVFLKQILTTVSQCKHNK
ncbi:zinc ABC transporter substrate-binding protein [Zooshikella harenae]|uniref:High-affinity zinc uptake system protein ZnuA n=1 Tax=Zooshikella harenae TaxID=2827238 RepID=A0ABS5ZFL5_9GAMM|nr:zinc ABC transporter substrate-binding protein [Zooshikella harenae]MBU2712563.1 zinc ABC transporter substrate-binding protein [Zooshikella harenae]